MVVEEVEDVFLWFSKLSSAKRVHVMYGLLIKCLPFELRFLGSCIEDLFKQHFASFRDTELRANSPADVGKLADLGDDGVRGRLVLCVAFLCSSNRTCANLIFAALTSQPAKVDSKAVLEELLLLFTLAYRHPAFTFQQKQALEPRLDELASLGVEEAIAATVQPVTSLVVDERGESQVSCEENFHYAKGVLSTPVCATCGAAFNVAPPCVYPAATTIGPSSVPYAWQCVPPPPRPSSSSPPLAPLPPIIPPPPASAGPTVDSSVTRTPCPQRPVLLPLPTPRPHVKHLELKNAPRKKKRDENTDFRIQVTWSNGDMTEVSKTHKELCDFHQQLTKTVRTPYFAGPKQSLRGDESAEDGTSRTNEYLRQLMGKVPLDSELVVSFFRPLPESIAAVQTNIANMTIGCDDQNVCSSPTAATIQHLNPTSPPPNVNSKYSVASPVHAFHCATVGVNDINHQLGSLTIYNSCHTNECTITKSPATINNNQQSCVRTVPSCEAPTLSSCPKNLASTGSKQGSHTHGDYIDDFTLLERVFEREKLSKLWDRLKKKHLTANQILNLTEEDLKNDGCYADKAEKILKLFRTYKQKPPNGFYSHTDVDHGSKSFQAPRHCSTPPAVQPSYCTVQTVQAQVYMPDAPIDLLASHCMDPMMAPHSVNNRYSSRNSPDTSRSYHVSASAKPMCNGEADEVKNKSFAENDSQRDYRPRRNSRGSCGNVYPKMKGASRSNDTGSRKSSLTSDVRSSQSPGCGGDDAVEDSEGKCGPHHHSYSNNIPYATRNGSSPLGISEDPTLAPSSPGLGNNNPPPPGNLPGIQGCYTGVYPPSAPHGQQQRSHLPPPQHMPSRPIAAMSMCAATCPCSRPSATPPPLPSPHPMSYPQIMPFFPSFPPTYHLAQHSTNGFVTTPPGVPPPRTFQFLHHSPEGMAEAAFQHQFNNMLQVQQALPPTTAQRMQQPPLPPTVPGFVAGPTPNVGFHGNPMHPTNLPPPPHVPFVPAAAPPRTLTCFNCGHSGHHGSECMEKTMDDISKAGQFQLSFNRGEAGSSDGCE